MTTFRPCIDLHDGQVKQIVGGTLSDDQQGLETNFVAEHDSAWFANLYRKDNLRGGHIIKLGPGNDEAAKLALNAWPKGMHLGGGINADNAQEWLDAGAEKVIITSYLFDGPNFLLDRLQHIADLIGKEQLVVDLSCRRKNDSWYVSTNRWQDVSDYEVNAEHLEDLSAYCSEFLIHAADVEGKCEGIDQELVAFLGKHVSIPCTYAGGAKSIDDLQIVSDLSNGKVDLTYGSALDIFGGTLVTYQDCLNWN